MVAAFGVVLAAVYLFKMLHLTIWGPLRKEENRSLQDLDWREKAALLPLCFFMLWIGVAPRAFLAPSEQALSALLLQQRARLERPNVDRPALLPPPLIAQQWPAFGVQPPPKVLRSTIPIVR